MKRSKKFITLILSLVLVLAAFTIAFAADKTIIDNNGWSFAGHEINTMDYDNLTLIRTNYSIGKAGVTNATNLYMDAKSIIYVGGDYLLFDPCKLNVENLYVDMTGARASVITLISAASDATVNVTNWQFEEGKGFDYQLVWQGQDLKAVKVEVDYTVAAICDEWAGTRVGDEVMVEGVVFYYGYNAFCEIPSYLSSSCEKVIFLTSDSSYGDFNISQDLDIVTLGSVELGTVSVSNNAAVTLDGAQLTAVSVAPAEGSSVSFSGECALDIDSISGAVSFSGATLSGADIDSISGTATFDGATITDSNIDSISGEATFSAATISGLDIDSIPGEATFSSLTLTNSDISGVTGAVTFSSVTLDGSEVKLNTTNVTVNGTLALENGSKLSLNIGVDLNNGEITVDDSEIATAGLAPLSNAKITLIGASKIAGLYPDSTRIIWDLAQYEAGMDASGLIGSVYIQVVPTAGVGSEYTFKAADGSAPIRYLAGGSKGDVAIELDKETIYDAYIYKLTQSGDYLTLKVVKLTPNATKTYNVTVLPSENGSVSSTALSMFEGGTVNITVKANEGYEFKALTVTSASGEVSVTKVAEGSYKFSMPMGDVKVSATFEKKAEDKKEEEKPSKKEFEDVNENDYFKDAVDWASENGIVNGKDDTHFAPNSGCTRAQFVAFLWRAAGEPVVNYAMPFTDVDQDSYYAEAVRWAASLGIVKGKSETIFDPNAVVTRAQAITFLARYAGIQDDASGYAAKFSDVAGTSYYANAVNWAAAQGITKGKTDTTFAPNSVCKRSHVVVFLYNYFYQE